MSNIIINKRLLLGSNNGGSSTSTIFTIATGGTITTFGNYKIHTFTALGYDQFVVSQIGTDPSIRYLVVAGGAGGGIGGGGAGGGGIDYGGIDGTDGLGGGGGGGGDPFLYPGMHGGKGIVIVRYLYQ